jgi:hypothetical protein
LITKEDRSSREKLKYKMGEIAGKHINVCKCAHALPVKNKIEGAFDIITKQVEGHLNVK